MYISVWNHYRGISLTTLAPTATAFYEQTLHLVYRGSSPGGELYWATLRLPGSGSTWTDHGMINPRLTTPANPALAAHKDKLYMVYRGSSPEFSVYLAECDGDSWVDKGRIHARGRRNFGTEQVPVEVLTPSTPSLASDGNKLYIIYQGIDTKIYGASYGDIYGASYGDNGWTDLGFISA